MWSCLFNKLNEIGALGRQLHISKVLPLVQWVEHIAGWLRPIYEAMWAEMKAVGYLQIDETPLKVLDPEVRGKAAQGYLWFFAVPGGDVILEFSRSRGQQVPRQRLVGFHGTMQTDTYQVYHAVEKRRPPLSASGAWRTQEEFFTRWL